MCYYEQKRWRCGYWRWAKFRRQCNKEYRTGETCGLKLVWATQDELDQCRLCYEMERKQRRLKKMAADMERWRREGNRPATIERTQGEYSDVEKQLAALQIEHYERVRGVA